MASLPRSPRPELVQGILAAIRPANYGVAIVRGPSMEPSYRDGDRLVVRYGARVRLGRAHVVRLPDGPAGPRPIAVKRVPRGEGTFWWVESDNGDAAGVIDSRTVGALPADAIIARVILRLPRRRATQRP